MEYRIVVTYKARSDIGKASDYYREISTALQNRFEDQLIKTIDSLKENPLHYQVRYRRIRIAFTQTFPFGIHFIIEGATIYVLRILHTRSYYR